MRQAMILLQVPTRHKGLLAITGEAEDWLATQEVRTGLLTLFIRHTSASLTVHENAGPPDTQVKVALESQRASNPMASG